MLALSNFRLPSGLIASALNILVFEVFSVRSLLALRAREAERERNRPLLWGGADFHI